MGKTFPKTCSDYKYTEITLYCDNFIIKATKSTACVKFKSPSTTICLSNSGEDIRQLYTS